MTSLFASLLTLALAFLVFSILAGVGRDMAASKTRWVRVLAYVPQVTALALFFEMVRFILS